MKQLKKLFGQLNVPDGSTAEALLHGIAWSPESQTDPPSKTSETGQGPAGKAHKALQGGEPPEDPNRQGQHSIIFPPLI